MKGKGSRISGDSNRTRRNQDGGGEGKRSVGLADSKRG